MSQMLLLKISNTGPQPDADTVAVFSVLGKFLRYQGVCCPMLKIDFIPGLKSFVLFSHRGNRAVNVNCPS